MFVLVETLPAAEIEEDCCPLLPSKISVAIPAEGKEGSYDGVNSPDPKSVAALPGEGGSSRGSKELKTLPVEPTNGDTSASAALEARDDGDIRGARLAWLQRLFLRSSQGVQKGHTIRWAKEEEEEEPLMEGPSSGRMPREASYSTGRYKRSQLSECELSGGGSWAEGNSSSLSPIQTVTAGRAEAAGVGPDAGGACGRGPSSSQLLGESPPCWYRSRTVLLCLGSYGLTSLLYSGMDEVLPLYASAPVNQGERQVELRRAGRILAPPPPHNQLIHARILDSFSEAASDEHPAGTWSRVQT